MISSQFRKLYCFGLFTLFVTVFATGCSSKQAMQAPQAVEVKAMQVIQRDTPVTYEFVGQVQAKNEVQIRAKVSGNIIAKMVVGGATVTAGQPLFQIDSRQYDSALLNAKAQLAQAEALLGNSRLDSIRYKKLAAEQAIAQQSVDTQLAVEQQNAAAVAVSQAKVQLAENDLQDTLIVAPFGGRIDVNELSLGGFVQAGSTVLATISSVDPMFVQFTMSENEYLKFTQLGATPADWGQKLKLTLSDGSQYPLTGNVEQVDRGLAQNTGTLSLKAAFDNPQKVLVPGMFARVLAQGEVRQGALLIPQRAVQQLLDKTFVTVVAEGDKAETRPVKLGARIGNLWMVEEGLTATDRVLVEGSIKIQPGAALKVVMIEPDDLSTQAKQ